MFLKMVARVLPSCRGLYHTRVDSLCICPSLWTWITSYCLQSTFFHITVRSGTRKNYAVCTGRCSPWFISIERKYHKIYQSDISLLSLKKKNRKTFYRLHSAVRYVVKVVVRRAGSSSDNSRGIDVEPRCFGSGNSSSVWEGGASLALQKVITL